MALGNYGNSGDFLVLIDPPRKDVNTADLVRFARSAQRLCSVSGEVDILVTGNSRLRQMNRKFRKKNKPTDVLSFPLLEGAGGNIAISSEIAAENASRYGHSLADELKILILHGLLHLAGYDHERDHGDMANRESLLRRRLRLPDALIERSQGPVKAHSASRC